MSSSSHTSSGRRHLENPPPASRPRREDFEGTGARPKENRRRPFDGEIDSKDLKKKRGG